MTDSTPPAFRPRLEGSLLSVVLRTGREGQILARERVGPADLSEVLSEAWREGCLRRGQPCTPLGGLRMRLAPKPGSNPGDHCLGYVMEVRTPRGGWYRCEFTVHSLDDVARRAAASLIERGQMTAGMTYTYEIQAEPADLDESNADEAETPLLTTTVRSPELTVLSVPLTGLVRQSDPVDLHDDSVFPVFFTAEALEKAERAARRGERHHPPVESGGALVGALASCPKSHEFFVIVSDVLEIRDAEESPFALAYTSRSWTRIQTVLKARHQAEPARGERLVGQCHGHNFMPSNDSRCDLCAKRPTCGLTSAFVSADDQLWTRVCLARQPWALCHIFGLSARNERVNRLYAWHDGRLQARGYYVLPQFDPLKWKPLPSP